MKTQQEAQPPRRGAAAMEPVGAGFCPRMRTKVDAVAAELAEQGSWSASSGCGFAGIVVVGAVSTSAATAKQRGRVRGGRAGFVKDVGLEEQETRFGFMPRPGRRGEPSRGSICLTHARKSGYYAMGNHSQGVSRCLLATTAARRTS